MSKGLISVKLIDSNNNSSEINLDDLTATGRQMVKDDLNNFLIKLDELDSSDKDTN
jgi:hypothetical protein